ncbi:MAG: DUF5715 family protein [Paludibacteraceae bacterium]|nr:DUF5715 family protein [Paludibacteraceae bacterium]
MKDINEKLLVTLWAMVALTLIIVLPQHTSSKPTCQDATEQAESSVMEETSDLSDGSDTPVATDMAPAPQRHLVYYRGRSFKYSQKFRDRNDLHLAAAQSIGLQHGPANRAAAEKMKGQLQYIATNQNYVVEDLTYSLPYLVPTAARRLDSIGAEFADILARNDLPHYRFRVTSVLRSQEDIKRLQRHNPNSISNSAHNYGTTFDLGYWHYDQPNMTTDSMTDDNLKLVLGQVLLNQQRAGHIYVKYEYKQCCFHVTVRN